MKIYKLLPENLAIKTLNVVHDAPFFISVDGEITTYLMSWMRLAGCPLNCAWKNEDNSVTICDSPQSSHDISKKLEISVEEAYNQLMSDNTQWVSITGGEPFYQPIAMELVDAIIDAGKKVKIETNGTIFRPCKATLISCSPKLSSSEEGLKLLADPTFQQNDTNGFLTFKDPNLRANMYQGFLEKQQGRYKPEVLKKMLDFYQEKIRFKFVINSKEDVEEVKTNYIEKLNIPLDQIFLMPQGQTVEMLNDKAEKVIEYCKILGTHYADRLHIRIWGDKIGV